MQQLTRRGVFGLGLSALLLPLTSGGSAARIGWCRRDPVLVIGGTRVFLHIYSEREILDTVTGPTKVDVEVPDILSKWHTDLDDGFDGRGYDVNFSPVNGLDVSVNDVEIGITVEVPAKADLKVKVLLTDSENDDVLERDLGRTNRPIVVKTRIPRN